MRLTAVFTGPGGRFVDRWRGRWVELLGRLVNIAGIVIAVGWFIALFQSHLKLIAQPGPVEYNEPAIWHATYLLDHGRNPYTAKELPGAAYCFGPLYNYVVIAFKPLLGGIDYAAHRTVSLIFLVASLGLLVRLMCRAGTGLGIALLSAAFYYGMCMKNIMITARPDTLGHFFFLLGIFIPWEKNYARWPSILGLVCAVVAFHCKFYFAVAGCATLLGVFMVRSKPEGCWLGVGYFAALVLSFFGFWRFFPFYYLETVVIQRGSAALNSREDISQMHTVMFFDRGWPYLVLMAAGLVAWLWRRRARRTVKAEKTKGPFTALSWLSGTRFEVLGLVFLIFLAVVFFYMGHNAGAYFTYHLHLLFPLMFVLAAHALTRRWMKIGFGALLAVFVMFQLEVPAIPDASGPYRRLEQLILNSRGEVLGIPCVTDVLERTGRRVLHNGNTMFLGSALADSRAAWDPMAAIIDRDFNETTAEVEAKVADRTYEIVLTESDRPIFCDEEILKKNYDKVEQVDYFTYFGHPPVRVWRPKGPGAWNSGPP